MPTPYGVGSRPPEVEADSLENDVRAAARMPNRFSMAKIAAVLGTLCLAWIVGQSVAQAAPTVKKFSFTGAEQTVPGA